VTEVVLIFVFIPHRAGSGYRFKSRTHPRTSLPVRELSALSLTQMRSCFALVGSPDRQLRLKEFCWSASTEAQVKHLFILFKSHNWLLINFKVYLILTLNPLQIMNLKKYSLSFLIVFFLSITSCKKEEVKANMKFDGMWTLSENCSASGPSAYPITLIRDSADPLKFSIKGIWEVPSSLVVCTIISADNNTFTAPRQKLNANFDIEILSSVSSSSAEVMYVSYIIYPTGSLTETESCTGRLTLIK
jgi:hypothetical protein